MMDGFRIKIFSSIDHAGDMPITSNLQSDNGTSWPSPTHCYRSSIQIEKKRSVSLKAFLRATARLQRVYAERCAAKLGLEASDESDTLFQSLLEVMQKHQLDFTDTFIELESIRFNGLKVPHPYLLGYLAGLKR